MTPVPEHFLVWSYDTEPGLYCGDVAIFGVVHDFLRSYVIYDVSNLTSLRLEGESIFNLVKVRDNRLSIAIFLGLGPERGSVVITT